VLDETLNRTNGEKISPSRAKRRNAAEFAKRLGDLGACRRVKVTIDTKPSNLSAADKKAVEDAGFSVASFKITGNFSDVNVQKDKHLELDGKNFHFISSSDKVLNGMQTLTIVDKDFLSAKDFKKYSAATKMECIKTGKAGNCCLKDGMHSEERVYHVII
jgi:hypothetical protein